MCMKSGFMTETRSFSKNKPKGKLNSFIEFKKFYLTKHINYKIETKTHVQLVKLKIARNILSFHSYRYCLPLDLCMSMWRETVSKTHYHFSKTIILLLYNIKQEMSNIK